MKKMILFLGIVTMCLLLQSSTVRAYCRSPNPAEIGLFRCPEENNIYKDVAWRTTNNDVTIYGIVDYHGTISGENVTGSYSIGGIEVKDAATGTVIDTKIFDPPLQGDGITFSEITVPKSSFILDSAGSTKVIVTLLNFHYNVVQNTGPDPRTIVRFLLGNQPVEIKFSNNPFPKPESENWYIGDVHYHTNYSKNSVEFGAPIKQTKEAAKAIGLDWITVTDHSFALKPEEFAALDNEINSYSDSTFLFITGEEVSCTKGSGIPGFNYNHYLAHGLQTYIPGDELFAAIWDGRLPETVLSCVDTVSKVNGGSGSFGYIAHPYLDDFFRDTWPDENFDLPFTGMQIWNYDSGRYDFSEGSEFDKGLQKWSDLISYRQIYISGGSDAHGDFNSLMGKVRTYVYSSQGLTREGILDGLKHGNSFITNGPFISFEIDTNKMGQKIITEKPYKPTLRINWKSTEEFGPIETISIIKNGRTVYSIFPHMEGKDLEGSTVFTDTNPTNSGLTYYRLVVATVSGYPYTKVSGYRAYTNPIWISTTRDAKTISAIVENTGASNATNVSIGFYEDGKLIDAQKIELIENQSSVPVKIGWNPFGGGKKTIAVKADDPNVIAELDESDNEASVIYDLETDRIVARISDKIHPSQTEDYRVYIDKKVVSAGYFLKWPGSDLNITLETPSGVKLDSNSPEFLNYIEFSSVPGEKAFKITNPEPGEWKLYVTAVDVPLEGEEFGLKVIGATTLTADISTDKPSYKQNETIKFFVNVSEDSLPNRGANVTLEVIDPSGLAKNITLYDNGNVADAQAGDGIYSAVYSGTKFAGIYNLTAFVTGTTSKGDQFVRLEMAETKVKDGMPPTVQFLTPKNGERTNITPTFLATFADEINGTGIDINSVHLFVDSSDVTGISLLTNNSIEYTANLKEGMRTARVEVKDNSDNSAFAEITFVAVDETPPVSNLIISGTKGNNDWYTSDVSITITATDNSGEIDKIEYSFDNATFSTYQTPIRITNEGNTTIYHRAVDKSGNIEQTKSQTTQIDKTAPKIENITPSEGEYTNLTPEIKVNFSDTGSGLDFSKLFVFLDGQLITHLVKILADGFKFLMTFNPGLHLLEFGLPDLSGNWITGALTFVATKPTDVIAPVSTLKLIGIEGIENWFRSDVTAEITATDIGSGVDRIEYSTDGTNFLKYTSSLEFSKEGTTNLYYRAIDRAGNIENVKVSAPYIINNFSDGAQNNVLIFNGSDAQTAFVSIPKTAIITDAKLAVSPVSSGSSGNISRLGWYEGDDLPTNEPPYTGGDTPPYTSDKWVAVGSQQFYLLDGGILGYYKPGGIHSYMIASFPELNNENGTTMQARVKVQEGGVDWSSGTTNCGGGPTPYGAYISIRDGEKYASIFLVPGQIWFASLSGTTTYNTDTTSAYHIYTLKLKGNFAEAYIDGNLVLTAPANNLRGSKILVWGAATSCKTGDARALWDYVRWNIGGSVPQNIALDVGADGTLEWEHTGILTKKVLTTNFSAGITNFLKTCGAETCAVPFKFTSDKEGRINLSNLYIYVEQSSAGGEPNKEEINIDKTPPSSTAKITEGTLGNNNWYRSKVKIEVSGQDDISGFDSIFYNSNSSETFTRYDGSYFVSEEGEVTLYYYAKDKAGNEEPPNSLTVRIDRTPPETISDHPLDWIRNKITLNLSAIDSVSSVTKTLYCMDRENLCTPSIEGRQIPVNAEGINYARYQSIDEAGNSEETKSDAVRIDWAPPEIVISSPENKTYMLGLDRLIFNYTITDNLGKITKVFSLDGNIFTPPSGEYDLETLAYGNHNFSIKAQDEAGNLVSKLVIFEVAPPDITPPVTTATGIDANWHSSDIQITLSAEDPLVNGVASGVKETYYIIYNDGASHGTKTISADGQPTITYEDDGNWIEYWSTDNAGNEEEHTLVKGIKLDKTNPNVDVWLDPLSAMYSNLEPLPVQYTASDPQVQGTPSNNLTLVWKIDGTIVSDPTNISGWLGTHTLTLTATDLAGNLNSDSVDFTVALELVGEDQLKITPEVLKVNPGILTVHINFPSPYDDSEILSGVCDYAAHDDIAGHNIKYRRKDIEEELEKRNETLDIHFEVNGTFSYNGNEYAFFGSDDITRIED